MKFLGSKVLNTEQLILRPTLEQDLEILYNILVIKEVNRYYLTSKIGDTFEKDKKYQMDKLKKANNKDVFQWTIVKKEFNLPIGQISVQESGFDDKSIRDVGWFIDPNEQRKGYSFKAASCVLNYMFTEVGIKKIITSSAIVNEASWRLMEKLGFERTGNIKYNKYTFVCDPIESYEYCLNRKMFLSKKK